MEEMECYKNEIESIILMLKDLREEKELKLICGYEYCIICDSINLLLEAKESFENKIEILKEIESGEM